MADKREESRIVRRQRRTEAKADAAGRALSVAHRAAKTLERIQVVATTAEFSHLLRLHGEESMPSFLTNDPGLVAPEGALAEDFSDQAPLAFAVAWKFLYPLMADPVFEQSVERFSPGLIGEMKDTFIAIVVEGPFPLELSGHVGRRHGGRYYCSIRRINRGSDVSSV